MEPKPIINQYMSEVELRNKLRSLLTEYSTINRIAVTNIDIDWIEHVGGAFDMIKVSLETKSYR